MKMRYLGLFALAPVLSQCQPACAPTPGPTPDTTVPAPVTTQPEVTTTTAAPTTTTQAPSEPWAPVTDPDLVGVSCSVVNGRKTAVLMFQAPLSDTRDYIVEVTRLDGVPETQGESWPYLGLNGVPNRGPDMVFSMDWPLRPDGTPATAMEFIIHNLNTAFVHEQHTWAEVDAQEPACSAVWGN